MGTLHPASASADSFFVYILRCADGSFYVGHTTNLEQRVAIHNQGKGATWTACRRPVELVYHENFASEIKAIARERQLKRWTHAKKHALIHRDLKKLKSLAIRHVR
jgi:predicted GIY-YIG superfamily endonuclease